MAAPQPTAATDQPPPVLPSLPKTEEGLVTYLRTFSLWCRNGFRDKLSGTAALPGILLKVYDVSGNPTNSTVMLTIKAGTPPTIVLTSIAAGSGQP